MSEPASPFGSKAVSKLATERLQEMSNCAKLAKMPLQEGAMMWLQSRKPFIRLNTSGPRLTVTIPTWFAKTAAQLSSPKL